MENNKNSRLIYGIGFALIIVLLGLSEYLEVYQGMVPCPLCMLQRVTLITLGTVFFVGMLIKMPKIGRIITVILSFLVSAVGMLLAGRQVWLQHWPMQGTGECGVSLSYLFKILPVTDALKQIWHGGMECSQTGWVFMHLSLAEWSLLWFAIFFGLALVQLKNILSAR